MAPVRKALTKEVEDGIMQFKKEGRLKRLGKNVGKVTSALNAYLKARSLSGINYKNVQFWVNHHKWIMEPNGRPPVQNIASRLASLPQLRVCLERLPSPTVDISDDDISDDDVEDEDKTDKTYRQPQSISKRRQPVTERTLRKKNVKKNKPKANKPAPKSKTSAPKTTVEVRRRSRRASSISSVGTTQDSCSNRSLPNSTNLIRKTVKRVRRTRGGSVGSDLSIFVTVTPNLPQSTSESVEEIGRFNGQTEEGIQTSSDLSAEQGHPDPAIQNQNQNQNSAILINVRGVPIEIPAASEPPRAPLRLEDHSPPFQTAEGLPPGSPTLFCDPLVQQPNPPPLPRILPPQTTSFQFQPIFRPAPIRYVQQSPVAHYSRDPPPQIWRSPPPPPQPVCPRQEEARLLQIWQFINYILLLRQDLWRRRDTIAHCMTGLQPLLNCYLRDLKKVIFPENVEQRICRDMASAQRNFKNEEERVRVVDLGGSDAED